MIGMATKEIKVQRFSVTSSKAFPGVVAAFGKAVGYPDVNAFRKDVTAAKRYAELEKIAQETTGRSELVECTFPTTGWRAFSPRTEAPKL
jgi:hypothetical protein